MIWCNVFSFNNVCNSSGVWLASIIYISIIWNNEKGKRKVRQEDYLIDMNNNNNLNTNVKHKSKIFNTYIPIWFTKFLFINLFYSLLKFFLFITLFTKTTYLYLSLNCYFVIKIQIQLLFKNLVSLLVQQSIACRIRHLVLANHDQDFYTIQYLNPTSFMSFWLTTLF